MKYFKMFIFSVLVVFEASAGQSVERITCAGSVDSSLFPIPVSITFETRNEENGKLNGTLTYSSAILDESAEHDVTLTKTVEPIGEKGSPITLVVYSTSRIQEEDNGNRTIHTSFATLDGRTGTAAEWSIPEYIKNESGGHDRYLPAQLACEFN